jgi:malate dehydrogenase (oxaloacetate-decarboxylating)
LLRSVGVEQIVVCDRQGALSKTHYAGDNPVKRWLAENTNPRRLSGALGDVVRGADVFIGVSAANVLREDDVRRMAKDPILFALANPDPEIDPDAAAPYAAVLATGRSDYPNQINNVLCFPGFFRGLLDVRAPRVIDAMKIAAAQAIAGVIPEKDLLPDYIVPSVFDRRVAPAVARAVAKTALESGVARREHKPGFRIAP